MEEEKEKKGINDKEKKGISDDVMIEIVHSIKEIIIKLIEHTHKQAPAEKQKPATE